jgi:iron complex transport system substrate-binding protein
VSPLSGFSALAMTLHDTSAQQSSGPGNYARNTVKISALAPLGVLAVTLSLMISGCQPGSYTTPSHSALAAQNRPPLVDINWLEQPRDWVGSSTATLGEVSIEPIEENPSLSLPTTVASDELSGELDVTITAADRVLALDMSGSLAATVWALGLGDRLVGRDISTTFPGVEDLPVVTGSGHAISPESVLDMRPDLVITDGTIGPLDVVLQLRDAGITVVFVREQPGLDAPAAMARSVAAIFGITDTGEALALRITSELDTVLTTIGDHVPTQREDKLRMVFLYIRGANGIYYLFGQESGAGDLIDGLGGIDIATEIGWTGLRPMTDEALIAANPDLILVMSDGLQSVGGPEELVRLKPAIGLTAAGQNLRFVDMDDSQVLSFGPRTPAVMDALARAIYDPAG